MNKAQLAQILSDRIPAVSKPSAERLLDEMVSIIIEKLRAGEEVALSGFGIFSARKRKGRIGVNPRNVSEKIEIPSVTVAKFKAGKKLKDSLKRIDKPIEEKVEEKPQEHESIKTQEQEENNEEYNTEEPQTEETPEEPEEKME